MTKIRVWQPQVAISSNRANIWWQCDHVLSDRLKFHTDVNVESHSHVDSPFNCDSIPYPQPIVGLWTEPPVSWAELRRKWMNTRGWCPWWTVVDCTTSVAELSFLMNGSSPLPTALWGTCFSLHLSLPKYLNKITSNTWINLSFPFVVACPTQTGCCMETTICTSQVMPQLWHLTLLR